MIKSRLIIQNQSLMIMYCINYSDYLHFYNYQKDKIIIPKNFDLRLKIILGNQQILEFSEMHNNLKI